MRDKVLIFAGLALFMLLVTFPVWHGISAGSTTGEPDFRKVEGKTSCVAPRQYMRESHMELLKKWRDAKVRDSRRDYRSFDGTHYVVSLSGTCLTQCHGSADEFCARCHTYAGVPATDCWHCHTSPPSGSIGLAGATGGGAR